MINKSVTDLEAMIIGSVVKSPDRTRYSVRMVFQRSLSGYWSGSAGAVYPAVDRLIARKFLKESPSGTASRPSKSLVATKAGQRQLAEWMNDTSGPALALIDPLRVKINFLDIVHSNDEVAWLESVEDSLRENLNAIVALTKEQSGDRLDEMISRGMIATSKAQLSWIRNEISRIQKLDK